MASDADEIAYQARVILAAQMYIESLEKVPGTDLYLLMGENSLTYAQAALCAVRRKTWVKAQTKIPEDD